jgi:hypothetical protein
VAVGGWLTTREGGFEPLPHLGQLGVDVRRVGSGVDSRDEQVALLGRELGVGLAEDRERAASLSGSTSASSASSRTEPEVS